MEAFHLLLVQLFLIIRLGAEQVQFQDRSTYIHGIASPFYKSRRYGELIGELMISSKAGTTLPDALTETSITPLSTVEKTKSLPLQAGLHETDHPAY